MHTENVFVVRRLIDDLGRDSSAQDFTTNLPDIYWCVAETPAPYRGSPSRRGATGSGCSAAPRFGTSFAGTALKTFAKACLKSRLDKKIGKSHHAPRTDGAREREEIYRLRERVAAFKERIRQLEDLNRSRSSADEQGRRKAEEQRGRLLREIGQLADELEATCIEKQGLEEALAEARSSRTTAAWLIGSGVALGVLTALVSPGKTASFIGFGVASAAFLAGFMTLVRPSAAALPVAHQ
jgi:hypothetical protein